MSEQALLTAPLDGSPAGGRLDLALARITGRLAEALTLLGDADAARALCTIARAGGDGPAPADGGVLGLPAGPPQPVDRLVAGLALGPCERDLLALALAACHHETVGAVLRSLHPAGLPYATAGLAGLLAEHGLLAGVTSRAALRSTLATGALLRSGLVAVDGPAPFPDRSLTPAPWLWESLTGLGGWPAGVRPDPRPAPPWGLDGWSAMPVVAAARTVLARDAAVTLLAAGERPGPLAGRLAALVVAAGRTPVVLHAGRIDGDLVTAVLMLALARGVVPVLWTDDATTVPLDVTLPPVPSAAGPAVPLLIAARTDAASGWPRPLLLVPGSALDRRDRLAAMTAALPEIGATVHPVGPASVEPGDLAIAAADVRLRSALLRRPLSRADLRRELARAIDARTGDAVPPGAALIHPEATWDDLVLPADRARQLREAVDRIRAHAVVLDRWGFLAGRPGARGLRLLFCGPPGTGKTLAAEVVAAELGRDLLVVDLSRLVSKWIGETEKNLAAVFDAAERGGAVLLFDEADALFGRRTEVGDARDRYANLETAYLLSRVERFDGVAVLATNLRQNLDTAFARRIEFIVPFDPPDEPARHALWARHLPPAAPVAADVDLAELAALYDLPGALIRNAAVAAAFVAAAEADPPGAAPVGLRHLVGAIRREYVKAGQAFPGPPSGLPVDPPSREEQQRWPHR